MTLKEEMRNQKGTVMVAVLIIALAVAIFSYSLLISSLDAIERSDVQDFRVKAKALAEGGLDESAYALKQSPEYMILPENKGILPAWAGGGTDEEIKKELISNDDTWQEPIDAFPDQSFRSAVAEHQISTYDSPDLFFIWGDTEDATYEYIDEETYKRHFFDYHYNPYAQESDFILGAGGEVDDGLNDKVFSFASRAYPSTVTRFQTRANSVWEQNENDPEPAYFESEHSPYDTNVTTRYWVVTYDYDPDHPGRNISRIDLIAKVGEVSIGSPGDFVWATGWNGTEFDPLIAVPPNYHQGPYTNATNLMTEDINSTTIRIGFRSDDIIDPPGLDYGFKLSGIRYHFDSDIYPGYYETPHPYDHLDVLGGLNPGIQVVYSPYQAVPPGGGAQRMRITFDWKFFLESGDFLEVWNVAATPHVLLDTLIGSAGAGRTYQAARLDPNLPLAIGLLLYTDGNNTNSTNNYGYLVERIEYTNEFDQWVTGSTPYIESPHLGNLGSFLDPFDPANLLMRNYIYRPHVPGGGTLDGWFVHFAEACDLYYGAAMAESDYIRITTPGFNPPGLGGGDQHYFVKNPALLGPGNYHPISRLKDFIYPCGKSKYMEILCRIDDIDDYANVPENWGFRVESVGYSATDANDFASIVPTIAAAVSRKPGVGYVNFGSGYDSRAEWWITERKLDDSLVEMLGIHFELSSFDLDPGDYLAIYDEDNNLVGTITYRSYRPEGPEGSGPYEDDPDASGPDDQDVDASPPENTPGWDEGTIDLNHTKGWVLVPGESAHIVLVGDGDDNEKHFGFRIDRTAWWTGTVKYESLGNFEKLDDLEKDVAEYKIREPSEFLEIR